MGKSKSSLGKYKDLSKNTLLFTISSFGSRIIAFLLVPLYTSVLTTNEYGTVDLITETASLLIPILTLDIQDAVMRFSLEDRDNKIIIESGINVALKGALILSSLLLVLKITGVIRINSALLVFLFLAYLVGALNNILTLYLKGIDKVQVIMVSGILNTGVMCLSNIVLLLVFHMGMMGYLISYVSGILVAVIYSFFVGGVYKGFSVRGDKKLTISMTKYSIPLIANVLAWWINSASDRYILTFINGVSANGLYSISYKIPSILSTIQTVFYNAWSISAVKEYDKEDKDGFFGNTYTMFSLICVLACSSIMIVNIPVARILFSKEFFEAWRFVPFLLVGTAFNGMALFEGCIFTATKQTSIISKTTMIGAAVNTIGNIVFIYLWGSFGAALSTMMSYIATWAMRTIKLRSIIKLKVDWSRHFLSLGIMAGQAILALFEGTYVWQVLCLIAVIISEMKYFKKISVKIISMKSSQAPVNKIQSN